MKETINACAVLVRMPEREFHLEDFSVDKKMQYYSRYCWIRIVVWIELMWLGI
jgi:hypothetical protein